MPRTPASAGVKLNNMYIAFAFAVAPVTFGSAIVCVLAGKHIISYWWLALTLGWAIVPLAVLARARLRTPGAASPAPGRSFPLAQD